LSISIYPPWQIKRKTKDEYLLVYNINYGIANKGSNYKQKLLDAKRSKTKGALFKVEHKIVPLEKRLA
jgi:hypothetical protein